MACGGNVSDYRRHVLKSILSGIMENPGRSCYSFGESKDKKLKALEGLEKGLSIRQAGEKFGIPRSTLQKLAKQSQSENGE